MVLKTLAFYPREWCTFKIPVLELRRLHSSIQEVLVKVWYHPDSKLHVNSLRLQSVLWIWCLPSECKWHWAWHRTTGGCARFFSCVLSGIHTLCKCDIVIRRLSKKTGSLIFWLHCQVRISSFLEVSPNCLVTESCECRTSEVKVKRCFFLLKFNLEYRL